MLFTKASLFLSSISCANLALSVVHSCSRARHSNIGERMDYIKVEKWIIGLTIPYLILRTCLGLYYYSTQFDRVMDQLQVDKRFHSVFKENKDSMFTKILVGALIVQLLHFGIIVQVLRERRCWTLFYTVICVLTMLGVVINLFRPGILFLSIMDTFYAILTGVVVFDYCRRIRAKQDAEVWARAQANARKV